MDDLISRQDAVNVCNNAIKLWEPRLGCGPLIAVRDKLADMPSVGCKKGKWIKGVGENGVSTSLFCSGCNLENRHWYEWNYCPHCGADMRGE